MTRTTRIAAGFLVLAGIASLTGPASAQSTEEVLGAVIGGTAGTWIGKELDKKGSTREGEIIGAVIGGSLGYVIGDQIDDRNDRRRHQQRRVYSQPTYHQPRRVYSQPVYSQPRYVPPRRVHTQPAYVAPRRRVVGHYPQGRTVYRSRY
ncbi:glycine zipper 2TM domain-containing protein [uncultured Algimonas sp.]|uniref:glycine zipper 2TM domain-containing protein n=1 Tax=uncultured Algimonas sp. TaxID=1547920 RepID=UPI002607B283|nr:glycine zipper 2TM domain-containing protein [uncultured Algimonas sp.]